MFRWKKRQLPQKYWLSFADGISISYVFLGLLPKIVERTAYLPATLGRAAEILKDNPFLPLLIGLVKFCGLERLLEKPGSASGAHVCHEATGLRVTIHLASYAIYKTVIGYLIVQMENPVSTAIFVAAVAVYLTVQIAI